MSTLEGTLRRGVRIAQGRAERRRREICEEARAMGVSARVEDSAVVLEGRGLLDRWLRDAQLRDVGRIMP